MLKIILKLKKNVKIFGILISRFRIHAAEIFEETDYKLKLIINAAVCYRYHVTTFLGTFVPVVFPFSQIRFS